jgi:hypothetical protein
MHEREASRRVVIGAEERSGWSSERTGRARLSQSRAHVLHPASTLRYAPRSLLLIASALPDVRARLMARLFPAQLVVSPERARSLLEGRVGYKGQEGLVRQVMLVGTGRRLAEGHPTVVACEGLSAEEREAYGALAASHRRSAHLIVLDSGRTAVPDEDSFQRLQALCHLARSGEVGAEGLRTALVLGRSDVDALRSVSFAAGRA